jgi:hypothetical protein
MPTRQFTMRAWGHEAKAGGPPRRSPNTRGRGVPLSEQRPRPRSPPRAPTIDQGHRRPRAPEGRVDPPLGPPPQLVPLGISEPAALGEVGHHFLGRHRFARLGPPRFSPSRRSDTFFPLVLQFGRGGLRPPSRHLVAPRVRGPLRPLSPEQDQHAAGRVIGGPLGDPAGVLQAAEAHLDGPAAPASVVHQRSDRWPAGGGGPRIEEQGGHHDHIRGDQPTVPHQVMGDRRKRARSKALALGGPRAYTQSCHRRGAFSFGAIARAGANLRGPNQ